MSSSTSPKPQFPQPRLPTGAVAARTTAAAEGGGGGGGGGKLVKVAFARNQAEAEMIQGLLLEAGIPSVLKRSRASTPRSSSPPGRTT